MNTMAASSKTTTDSILDEMKNLAIEHQQNFYELLPDCIKYDPDERKYLKVNIGYAIYGPPLNTNENINATESTSDNYTGNHAEDEDVADILKYDTEAQSVIDMIYNKICECAEIGETDAIYVGIIYNIIYHTITGQKKKTAKKTANVEEDMKQVSIVHPVPIFKTSKKNIQEKTGTANGTIASNSSAKTEADNEIWYIDISGRVYKNWTDYTSNNKLPKCTMVLPKDGCYQANPSYPCTEDYSTVWLEIMDSPACAWQTKLCTGMDIASGIVGFGTIGIGIASMFTPVAPLVALSGVLATGVTGVWNFARCSQQLVDRSQHEESINPINKEAFLQWLGAAGSVFGLGAVGGSVAISTAVTRGITIHSAAKMAFNAVQGGNLFLNGVGLMYQGYCMLDKYVTENTFSYLDMVNLVTHLMFFAGTVTKVQFAGDIIQDTQGRIINDYRSNLQNKRLRYKFNRVSRRAATNNTCKISENAEVIRYIRNREQLLSSGISGTSTTTSSQSTDKQTSKQANGQMSGQANGQTLKQTNETTLKIVWTFQGNKLRVNGIVLIDPLLYVDCLLKTGILKEFNPEFNSERNLQNTNDSTMDHLSNVFSDLLRKYYLSPECPRTTNLPLMPDFEPLLKEMRLLEMNEDSLKKLFAIVTRLVRRFRNVRECLLQAFYFVWTYCKENLRQWGMSVRCRVQSIAASRVVRIIIIALFEAIDMILTNLFRAFEEYITDNMIQLIQS